MEKINLNNKYKLINEKWSPHSIAELNGQQVLLAKVEGEFVWHAHEKEDELFYVVKGKLFIEFRDKTVELSSKSTLKTKQNYLRNAKETGYPYQGI